MKHEWNLLGRMALLGGALTVGLLLIPGCGGELIEKALCKDAAGKICEKWFECWPIASNTLWGSEAACATSMDSFCDDSEAWTGCDVDNAKLTECNDGIEGSACGTLPAACSDLKDCYDAQ